MPTEYTNYYNVNVYNLAMNCNIGLTLVVLNELSRHNAKDGLNYT